MTDHTAEVHDLLERMARAITAGDGQAMTAIWETPALVLGDDGVMSVTSDDEVAKFYGGSKEQYNSMGIVDTRPEMVSLSSPTEKMAIVEVRWPWLDAQGATRGAETSTYTLRRDDRGQLRLRVAVMHGAKIG